MDVHGAPSTTIMGGSAAAAFAAGMIAFFAPCCSGVMLPSYLAAVAGGNRFRVARLTAIYVAGVAAVVWPITLGAGAIGQWTSRFHPQLFVIGGLMMVFTAITLWRGSMMPLPIPQPELTGTAGSVFVLGVFSGAATACCAPVLAGAVALSALNQSWLGGFALGGAYLMGIVTPLVLLALVFNGAKKKLRDPKLTLAIAQYRKRISLSRLVGAVVFGASGLFFIGLALAGESQSGNSVQRWISRQLNHHVATHAGQVPNWVTWPALAVLAALLVFLVVKPRHKEQPS
ncbi:MAG TPA: cytochrome c biogenesis protein CcdA [Gaiellaceae bacterium]|nr:cytochrome c biogenesis protein CcdA [Gaiellaceae bacterium]